VDIAERRVADVVVVAPVGAIDFPNAQLLEHALAPHLVSPPGGTSALVLDLGHVGYVSSMGLRVLMVAARALRPRNARIAVSSLQPVVAEIFDIARFNHVVEIFPTVRDALAALSPSALAAWDGAAR
jgi:anti-anti-sigma factor